MPCIHIYVVVIVGSATDHPYAELCSGTSNSSLVNLVAVWSPSTRDVYRNQYCALCYNVTDYQSLSIDIGDITGYLDEDENVTWGAIEYILTHSTTANTFKIYPADQLRFAMPYCNIGPVISECRDDYDVGPLGVVIRQQCDNGPFHPYIIEEFDVITDSRVDVHAIYKNVYCTICHSELHDAQSISFQSCIFRQSILSWAETKPVSNPKQYTAPQKIRRLLCEATEIMDPYMHRCRQLVCPNFSLAYNGACYYTHIDDEPRTVSYLVEPGIDLPPTEIMRYLEHIFSGYRYLRNHPLYVCSVELANNDTGELSTSNGYYVSIGFQAHGRSEWYSYRHIRDADQFIATERKFGYQLPARLLKGVDARTSQYTTRWLDPDRKQCNGTFSVIEVWCPTIELSESDIAYCETRGVLPKYFEFNNPSEIARDRSVARQICVQDYLRLWANASIANRFYVGPFAHTILTYSLIACFLFQQV